MQLWLFISKARASRCNRSLQFGFIFSIYCHITDRFKLTIKVQQVDERLGNVVSFGINRFLDISPDREPTCCSFAEPR